MRSYVYKSLVNIYSQRKHYDLCYVYFIPGTAAQNFVLVIALKNS